MDLWGVSGTALHLLWRRSESGRAGECAALATQQHQLNGINKMKRYLKPAMLAAVTAILVGLPMPANAQQGGGGGRGNFDPEQMRQRMMERYKEVLAVKSDDEWKVIEPRIQKINEARREVGFGGGMRGGMFGAGQGRRGGGGGDQAEGQGRRGGFGPQPSAAAQDLQKAIDSGASAEQIKTKLAAYRAERQQKQANLEKAQEELKKVLSVKQEAAAVMAGLVD